MDAVETLWAFLTSIGGGADDAVEGIADIVTGEVLNAIKKWVRENWLSLLAFAGAAGLTITALFSAKGFFDKFGQSLGEAVGTNTVKALQERFQEK